jgi:putative transposase
MTKSEAKPAIAAVNELFSKSPDGLREIVRAVMQEMLEAEMTDALGAEKGERTAARPGYRSGYYTRTLVTRVGNLELRVPQDRDSRPNALNAISAPSSAGTPLIYRFFLWIRVAPRS